MSETNNNRGQVEQQLQDAFSEFAVTADDAVWESIEAAIQPEKKRRGAIWWFSSGVAAGVAALIISYTVFQSTGDQNGPTSPAVAGSEQEQTQPAQPESGSTIIESTIPAEETALAAEDQAAQSAATNATSDAPSEVVEEVVAAVDEDVQSVDAQSVAEVNEANAANQEPTAQVAEEIAYATEETAVPSGDVPAISSSVGYVSNFTTTELTPAQRERLRPMSTLDRRYLNADATLGTLDSIDWEMEPYAVSSGKPEKDDWSDWEDGHDPNGDQGWGLLANLESAGSNTGPAGDANSLELMNEQQSGFNPTSGGPIGIAEDYSTLDATEVDYRSPLTIGLRAGFSFTRRWSLESGLSYSRLSSVSTWTQGTAEQKTSVNQHFIGAPLLLSYKFVDRKRFGMYSTAGVQVEKGIATVAVERDIIYGVELEENKLDVKAPGVQGALVFGLGADYKINRFMSLYAQPSVSSWLLNHNVGRNVRNRQYLWPSVQMGLRFDL